MFFNAMRRKGWDPREEDMSRHACKTALRLRACFRAHAAAERALARSVVAIHNTVNERAWREVLAWEALHHRWNGEMACVWRCVMSHSLCSRVCARSSCPQPRLVRFVGRPQDFSPKARLLNLLGYKLPFDRHDWVVDRCGYEARPPARGACRPACALTRAAGALRQVRYVVDFYNAAPEPGKPIGMHLDVRPALDSSTALLDRIRMQWRWATTQAHTTASRAAE
jgi:cytochrome c heme-lyase